MIRGRSLGRGMASLVRRWLPVFGSTSRPTNSRAGAHCKALRRSPTRLTFNRTRDTNPDIREWAMMHLQQRWIANRPTWESQDSKFQHDTPESPSMARNAIGGNVSGNLTGTLNAMSALRPTSNPASLTSRLKHLTTLRTAGGTTAIKPRHNRHQRSRHDPQRKKPCPNKATGQLRKPRWLQRGGRSDDILSKVPGHVRFLRKADL